MSANAYEVDSFVLDTIRNRGGKWAVYENQEIAHPQAGHLQFLAYGLGKSCLFAPERMPDTATQINWRYRRIGYLDLDTGEVVVTEKMPHPLPFLGWRLDESTVTLEDLITGNQLILVKPEDEKNKKLSMSFMTVRPDGAVLLSSVGNDTYPGTLLKVWLQENRITQEGHDRALAALQEFEAS